ncbi:GNAT family N-acetyltransferase [Rhizobium sp. PAMB 3174]
MNAIARELHIARISFARQPEIRTQNLILRQVTATDVEAIALGLDDHAVARMLPPVPQPYYREDAEEWLGRWQSGEAEGWCFAITRDGGPLIGVISIENRDGEWHLGYWLARPHWGQGLMSEAASAVAERFFGAMLAATLHSGAVADNAASLAIQDKIGFAVTGCREVWCAARSETVTVITTELTFGSYMPI